MKIISKILIVLSLVLSHIMCGVVAYNYCNLLWGGKYAGFSAPPGVAFFYAIPYIIAIVACLVLAFYVNKRNCEK